MEAVGGAVFKAASSRPKLNLPPVAGACWRDLGPGCSWLWDLLEELWGQRVPCRGGHAHWTAGDARRPVSDVGELPSLL